MIEMPVAICFVILQRLYEKFVVFTLSSNKVNMVVCW